MEWSLKNKIESSGAVIIRELSIQYIYFSKKNLRSILYNLISNGIKFKGNETPLLRIRAAMSGDDILFSVQDNGVGIQEKDLAKIFSLYGRLHQEAEGQGGGLYLAQKIVHAAGGTIVVESEVGRGSKFIIHLRKA